MPEPANGRFHDEHTPLIGRTQNYANESRVKTLPKHVVHLIYATLASNYVNVLLVFVPIGIVAGILSWNATVVFVLNFIAIIPLAALLSFATEELSAKLGQTLGGLMNATFGNAVELIVSARAHIKCPVAVAVADSDRCLSSLSGRAKSELYRPACSVASCPTFFLYVKSCRLVTAPF